MWTFTECSFVLSKVPSADIPRRERRQGERTPSTQLGISLSKTWFYSGSLEAETHQTPSSVPLTILCHVVRLTHTCRWIRSDELAGFQTEFCVTFFLSTKFTSSLFLGQRKECVQDPPPPSGLVYLPFGFSMSGQYGCGATRESCMCGGRIKHTFKPLTYFIYDLDIQGATQLVIVDGYFKTTCGFMHR